MTLRLNPLQLRMLATIPAGVGRVGVRAGWGSGKTFGEGFALKAIALGTPGCHCMWVTDTRPRLQTNIQPICQELLGTDGWTWRGEPSEYCWVSPPINGRRSRIWLRSFMLSSTQAQYQNPLEGPTLLGLAADECQVYGDDALWRAVTGRMRGRGASRPWACFVGLPVPGAWWMDRVSDAGGKLLHATSYANRANLPVEYFEDLKAGLSSEDYEAFVLNKPRTLTGQVLDTWSDTEWPEGNVLDGWTPDPDRAATVAVDFGRRTPAVLLIQHDPERQTDVVFAEAHPDECLVDDLVSHINALAVRHGVTIRYGAGDPAGRAQNDQTGVDSIELLGRPRPRGVGIRLRYETDPVRRHVPNGIRRLRGLIRERRLSCTREVWDAGLVSRHRSLAKSILGYRYPDKGGDDPLKDGIHDHAIDAWRYYVVCWRWMDSELDRKLEARMSEAPAPRAARLKRGGF